MLKNFSLLVSILIAGKLIAATNIPGTHPAYDNDLSSAQPVRIPTEQPALPIGTPTTIFPIDPGTISNPVVNPVSDPLLVDDALGVDKPKPSTLRLVVTPAVSKPTVTPDGGDLGVTKPVIVKPGTTPAPLPVSDDSDDDSVNFVVDDLLPDSSDEEDMFDEDDAELVKKPANAVTTNEETRLNGTTNKPQGMISWLFSGCYSTIKNIVCWPFRCFYWCCGYDSASDAKKSN